MDLIVTSPPYADQRLHTFGGTKPEEYNAWFLPRAAEMRRVLKPSGSFVLNIKEKCVKGERHPYVLELILSLRSEIGFFWVEEYIWHKKNSLPMRPARRLRDAWERLLHFSKEYDFKFRPKSVMMPASENTRKRMKSLQGRDFEHRVNASGSGFGYNLSNFGPMETVYPSNVLHKAVVTRNTGHSAAFPEWLPEFFIKLMTDEGDLVIDPFSGSGTTCRVAERLGREAIGIDILEDPR